MIVALIGFIAVACSATDRIPVDRGSAVEIVARAAEVSVVAQNRDEIEVMRTGVDCKKLGNVYRLEATGETTILSVKVPSWMPVKIAASEGGVRVDGVQASVDVDASRGDIWIRGGRERVIARTGDGSVDIAEAQGQIDIQVQHRPVTLTNSSGDVQIVNVTGMTTLTDVRAGRLSASTVNGEVRCQCVPEDAAEWQLRASTGAVRLVLPAGVGAVVTLDAPRNASIVSYLGAVLQQLDARQLVAVLGKGGARIRLSSFSGAVFLALRTSTAK